MKAILPVRQWRCVSVLALMAAGLVACSSNPGTAPVSGDDASEAGDDSPAVDDGGDDAGDDADAPSGDGKLDASKADARAVAVKDAGKDAGKDAAAPKDAGVKDAAKEATTIPIDAGVDAGKTPDASTFDATLPDANGPDANAPDANAEDATTEDATVPDATVPDATVPDATVADANDASSGDTGISNPDDAGMPGDSTGKAGVDALCQAACNRAADCYAIADAGTSVNVPVCLSSCESRNESGVLELYRQDVMTNFVSCVSSADCQATMNDTAASSCQTTLQAQTPPSASATALCLQFNRSTCENADNCLNTWNVLSEPTISSAAACVSGTDCNAQATCLATVLRQQ